MLRVYSSGVEFLHKESRLVKRAPLHLREFFVIDATQLNNVDDGWGASYTCNGKSMLGLKVGTFPAVLSGDTDALPEFVSMMCVRNLSFEKTCLERSLIDRFVWEYEMRSRKKLDIGRSELGMSCSKYKFRDCFMRPQRATPEDVPSIIRCITACRNSYKGSCGLPEDIQLFVESRISNEIVLRVDGEVVSVAGIRVNSKKTATVTGVYTHPEYRNRGYAQMVVGRAVAEIRNRRMLPLLFCFNDNYPAIRVYENLGFKVDGVYVEVEHQEYLT